MSQSRTVEEGHGEAGVVQGRALGHVQVGEAGGRGRPGPRPRHRDGGDHGAACNGGVRTGSARFYLVYVNTRLKLFTQGYDLLMGMIFRRITCVLL